MLCYRCGSHVPDGTEVCGTCGQRFALGLKPGPIAGFGTGTRRHRIAVETAPYKVGEVIAGRFEIRENVGAGPVGWVFKCIDRDLDVDVAVKVLSPRLLQQAEERRQVVTELRNVRRLSHPNIVRLYEDGTDGDRLFFTMQHLEGLALRRVWDLRRQKGQLFTVKEAEQIVVQVAAGLDAALEVSAHGDLKPDNLIILPDILKITDFGLANALPRAPFMAAQKAGGVHRYVAPEFLQGERISPRTDVFSLAVIVGEMLSGSPFEGQGFELLARNPALPKSIDTVFRKATALDAEQRFATAGEFAAAFLEASGAAPAARTTQNLATVAAVPQSTPPAVRPVAPAPPPPPAPPRPQVIEPSNAATLVAAVPARVENVEQTGTMSPAIRVRAADAPRENTEEVDDAAVEEETVTQERTVLAAPGTAGVEEVTDPGPVEDDDDERTSFGTPGATSPMSGTSNKGASDDRNKTTRHGKRDKKGRHKEPAKEAPKEQKAAPPPPPPVSVPPAPRKEEPKPVETKKPEPQRSADVKKTETPRPAPRPDSRPDVKKVDAKKADTKPPTRVPPPPTSSKLPVLVALGLLVAIGLFLVLSPDPSKPVVADAGNFVAATEAVVSSDGTAELVDADAPVVDAGPALDAGTVVAAKTEQRTDAKVEAVDAGTTASKADQRAEAKRKAEEEAKARAEAKRLADEEARAEAKRVAEEKAAQKSALAKLDEERKAAEAAQKAETAARVRDAAARAEADRKAAEAAAAAKAEADRKAKEAEAAAKAEAERKAKEEAAAKAAAAATPGGTTCPKGMVYIKPGTFTFGAPDSDDLKNVTDWDADQVELDGFCVDIYEGPNRKGIKPSTGFTWKQAADACRSSGKRLCTEEEWERACKGGGSLRFPYGKGFDAAACNTQDDAGEKRDLGLAGAFTKCASGFGIVDMSGNAAEWTASEFEEGEADKVVKGGSSERPAFDVRCAARVRKAPGARDKTIGYRCCADPK